MINHYTFKIEQIYSKSKIKGSFLYNPSSRYVSTSVSKFGRELWNVLDDKSALELAGAE